MIIIRVPTHKHFDLVVDWNAIESSFYYDYRIDLVTTNLTTRQFYVLLYNLSEDSPLMRIVRLRKYRIPKIKLHDIDAVARRNEILNAKRSVSLNHLLQEEMKNVS